MNTLGSYIQQLNLEPIVSYSEQTTRSIALNYLSQLGQSVDQSILGAIATSCIKSQQRLELDASGAPFIDLCVSRELIKSQSYSQIGKRVIAAIIAIIISIILLILVKSSRAL